MYKIRNKTRTSRKFREHKKAHLHFLRPGEEMTISNPPVTNREDVFEITDLSQKSTTKTSKSKVSKKSKTETQVQEEDTEPETNRNKSEEVE